MLNHHSSPAYDAILMQHVFDGPLFRASGACSSTPFSVRVVRVLNNNTFKGFDVVYCDTRAQIGIWMYEIVVWLKVEMECGVVSTELDADSVVPGDQIGIRPQSVGNIAFGQRLVPMELKGHLSRQNFVADAMYVL